MLNSLINQASPQDISNIPFQDSGEEAQKQSLSGWRALTDNWKFAGIPKCALDIRAKWSGIYCVW